MSYMRLQDDVLGVVARQLHYFENLERIRSLKTAAEVTNAIEGGVDRFRNDPIFHAKVQSMTAVLMRVVIENIEKNKP